MKHQALLLLSGVLCSGVLWSGESRAVDRSIDVPAKVAVCWGFLTNSSATKQSRTLGVGFWQRASGAKPGVGAVFASAMEYQLPEAAPSRVRSATFRFSGRPSQCVGAEPVVVDVFAYVGDGRGEIGDMSAGSHIAQLSADCNDRAAFSRPIDVTNIVRQASVASGVRFVGFNVRKANNRQGPGLFDLTTGKLTVVIGDEVMDKRGLPRNDAAAAHKGMPPVAAAQRPRMQTHTREADVSSTEALRRAER
jgi:hypothetical protein